MGVKVNYISGEIEVDEKGFEKCNLRSRWKGCPKGEGQPEISDEPKRYMKFEM